MDFERTQYMGQREQKKLELKKLELSIKGLKESIRTQLNPFITIEEIDQEVVAAQAFDLAEKVIKYKALVAEIAAINKALGA
ncbi:MAG: hypothetical protein JEZ12_24000 [Desulfobacterium sp.]|nr:hypothetical protein [Desulfobacterium sp.]